MKRAYTSDTMLSRSARPTQKHERAVYRYPTCAISSVRVQHVSYYLCYNIILLFDTAGPRSVLSEKYNVIVVIVNIVYSYLVPVFGVLAVSDKGGCFTWINSNKLFEFITIFYIYVVSSCCAD